MAAIEEYVNNLPNISGQESLVEASIQQSRGKKLFVDKAGMNFEHLKSVFAVALHMQQPLIPAGGNDLKTAEIISNLKYMMDNQHLGDNHNAPVFQWCYKRMGEIIPQLISEGKKPRVMLEYTGVLFHGLRNMGAHDVIDALKTITCRPEYQDCVEWLGCPWGHAVAPSTPVQDFRLHVKAWQHHFAAIFGFEALERVRGFSPSEMALPNHPDVAYEFVKTLKDCGYQWVLVQEHTVEMAENGGGIQQKHLPHQLVCKNSKGDSASIIAIIKTQGSDTKLVAQMQPYYEAKSLNQWQLCGKSIPPLVTQIADGENGGVMMNEFPSKYIEVIRECSHSQVPAMNVSEYLEYLFGMGIKEQDLPKIQPVMQHHIWARFTPGNGADRLREVIEALKKEDQRFHMDGGSWTNNISWVHGYDNVLGPMEQVSSLFFEKVLKTSVSTNSHAYRNALFHLLSSQTSCYRYWGQGLWTDYGQEICRRAIEILNHDF
ncbi:MAG: glycosyl hydrolase family 57 [SAR324 cluster bacterium]|nr:glycosyl hydrolase family 57 [SAR324 cluster bacterium]